MTVLSMKPLPLGFRFRPTDEELINHYLRLKINGRDSEVEVIPEIDICKWEPWDLPGLSVIKTDDPEWFFFCPRDRKYPTGHRSNRATGAGYWKATGKDRTIKSRKFGVNARMIGMKKTLVFYRGRAPKGERTHWIMHEYRPTEKDMDGSGPGQSAFLLCRLFRKPDEIAEADKYDEAEPTGSSSTPTKSSPDDASSDVVQDIVASGIQDDISRWLTDKSDNLVINAPLPADSCSNSYMAFDVVDGHSTVETAIKACPLDCKFFSPVQSQNLTDLPEYLNSPFVDDFGHDHSGLQFQDGSSEQDVSLTELLDGFFNIPEEFSCEESTFQKPGHTGIFQVMPVGNRFQDNGSYSDNGLVQEQHNPAIGDPAWFNEKGTDLVHMQNYAGYSGAPISFHEQEIKCENFGAVGNNYTRHEALSADALVGFNHLENGSGIKIDLDNTNKNGSDFVGGTGIKIRSRSTRLSPNQPSSGNIINQGTAPRRIRLQVNTSAGPVPQIEAKDDACNQELDEEQSTLEEVKEGIEQTPIKDEPVAGHLLLEHDKSRDISEKFSMKLRLRVKQNGILDCNKQGVSSREECSEHPRASSLLIYIVGVSLVLILITVLGFWKCVT